MIGKLFGFSTKKFEVLYLANARLIKGASIFPKLKCQVSGGLYKVSPRLSGYSFRLFNYLILKLTWLFIFSITYSLLR